MEEWKEGKGLYIGVRRGFFQQVADDLLWRGCISYMPSISAGVPRKEKGVLLEIEGAVNY